VVPHREGVPCLHMESTSRSAKKPDDKRGPANETRSLALEEAEAGEGAEQRRPMWSPRMSPAKEACGCTTPCSSTTAHSGHDDSPHPHCTRICIAGSLLPFPSFLRLSRAEESDLDATRRQTWWG
jgi:hypothetical protein